MSTKQRRDWQSCQLSNKDENWVDMRNKLQNMIWPTIRNTSVSFLWWSVCNVNSIWKQFYYFRSSKTYFVRRRFNSIQVKYLHRRKTIEQRRKWSRLCKERERLWAIGGCDIWHRRNYTSLSLGNVLFVVSLINTEILLQRHKKKRNFYSFFFVLSFQT